MKNILLLSTAALFFSFASTKDTLNENNYKIYSSKTSKEVTLNDIALEMKNYDVVFFGEEHNDSVAHFLQTELFKALYASYGDKTTLSMEMFETDCQVVLDEYLQGYIREKNFFKEARVWSNYRNYKPMIEFAKEKKLSVVAGNAPARYVNMAARKGRNSLNELSATAKTFLPPLPYDTASGSYWQKFTDLMSDGKNAGVSSKDTSKKAVAAMNSMMPKYMVHSQSLWDATMAYSISKVFTKNSGANIRLELKKSLKRKTVELEINSQNGTKVRTSYLAITDDNLIQNKQLSLDKNEFILSDEDDVAKYVIKVKYLSDYLVSSKSSALEAHAVIYVPAIMQSKGWTLAKSSQDDWFNGSGNNFPWDADPKINYFTFDKALENTNFNAAYNLVKNAWQNDSAKSVLRRRIKNLMVVDGNATLPTQNNTTTFFYQINSYPIVTVNADHEEGANGKALEKMPICEKYYFQSREYKNKGDLDDFYASIANCNIRFVCNGKLEYKGVNNIEVTITTVGVYIKDGFDFVDDKDDLIVKSQWLGFWSIKNNNVDKIAIGPSYRLIDNDSYKAYRLKTRKGMDCYRYSTFKLIENLNFKFKL